MAGVVLWAATWVHAAEYGTPRPLLFGDTFRLNVDGYTGDEGTTQPKTDANDGLNGDSPPFSPDERGAGA